MDRIGIGGVDRRVERARARVGRRRRRWWRLRRIEFWIVWSGIVWSIRWFLVRRKWIVEFGIVVLLFGGIIVVVLGLIVGSYRVCLWWFGVR